jgi:type I restriction enzyme, S subunit
MEVSWTQATDVEGRIDAEFYGREFVEASRRLDAHVRTESFRKLWAEYNRIYIGIAGFEHVADPTLFTPYLRPVDITDDGFIDYDHLPWCKREWLHDHEKNGCAKVGDLIVEVKGNTRRAAVVSNRIPPKCIVSGSSYRITLKEFYDAHFVQAFLQSETGQKLKRRLTSNTTINYIDPESFREYRVPIPSNDVQKAIGHKIRKAERLRELARAEWHSAVRDFQDSLGIDFSPSSFSSFSASDIQTAGYRCCSISPAIAVVNVEDELGAQYFHPRRVHARRVAARTGRWQLLCEVAPRVSRGSGKQAGFLGLDAIDSSTGIIDFSLVSGNGEETGCSRFVAGDLLFSRLRPYLNKVSIWPAHHGKGRGSGELLVYRPHTIDPHYLFFVAKGPLGLNQVIDVTAGSTHPRVDAEVVDEIRIPRLDDDDEKRIGNNVRRAHACWYQTYELLPKAKSDIENLIAGTLDEATLLREGKEIAAWLDANPLPHETSKRVTPCQ